MLVTLLCLLLSPLQAQPVPALPPRVLRRPPHPPGVTGNLVQVGQTQPGLEETKDPSLLPEWQKFMPGLNHRLPEAFFLRNRIRALLLHRVDGDQLALVKRANRLAPASKDGLYLETYLKIFLEDSPVLHERRIDDVRVSFLRFFEAFKYGDMEQALILFNTLYVTPADRFQVSLILGHHLLRYGVLDQAYQYFRRALTLLETSHAQFVELRGTDKRNLFSFALLCMAEIQLKGGQYRYAYGLLKWLEHGRLLAATDPLPCTWEQILERRCTDSVAAFPSAEHEWYRHDPEMLAFHRALLAWSRGWAAGPKAFEAYLTAWPESMWTDAVRSYINWTKTNPSP
jgi:tetratricopeptide (TPR) repeat protein